MRRSAGRSRCGGDLYRPPYCCSHVRRPGAVFIPGAGDTLPESPSADPVPVPVAASNTPLINADSLRNRPQSRAETGADGTLRRI